MPLPKPLACIAGGINGAYLGVASIPGKWVRCIEKTKFLEELAIRLTAAKGAIG